MALADAKKAALSTLGYSGSVVEMEKDYYEDSIGHSSDFNTANYEWLATKGFTVGSLNDRWYAYLKSLGLSGALPNMQYDYWSNHPSYTLAAETNSWLTRVTAAGGAVNTPTRTAVNNFVVSTKASGVWPLFTRLNLCCGDFLASFIPLVNTGGGAQDTNANLLSSDYSQALGWQTDGVTKLIDTGYILSAATGSLSVYLRTTQASTVTPRFMAGASGPSALQTFALRGNRNGTNVATAGAVSGVWGGLNTASNTVTTGGAVAGLWQVTRRAATDAELYFNGVSVDTDSTSVIPATSTYNLLLFCANTGSPTAFVESGTRIAGYAVATGMTTAQALSYYTAFQTFQTALSRQV